MNLISKVLAAVLLFVGLCLQPVSKANTIEKEKTSFQISSTKNYGLEGSSYRVRITPIENTESIYNYYWEEYDPSNNTIIAYGYGYISIPLWATNIHAYIAGNASMSDSGGMLIVIIDDEEDD